MSMDQPVSYTHLYMSDEISRAERMKNDFISSVSHELRTPLTAIGGWSETLLAGGGEDPEEVMQGLTIIQKESNRLTRMVEELLDFARIESGRMKLEVELFDLSIELYEAVYMYENLLHKSGIQLSYDEDVDANYYINGDRHRLKQVFLNILDNAAKYGADGKKIDIVLRRDGGKIVASVRDLSLIHIFIADETTKTSLPGVYAVGDVRTKPLRQVVTAVADGAVSAIMAEEYLAEGDGKPA